MVPAVLLMLAAPEAPPLAGGDADSHGCRASAGYVWSPLRADCVRLFESGFRLDPVRPAGSAVISAFALFGGTGASGPVELWLPGGAAPVRLTGRGGLWRGHGWALRRHAGRIEVRHAGELTFAGPYKSFP